MKRNIVWLAGALTLLGACDESEYELQNLVPEEYHKILYVNNSGKQDMLLYDTDEDYTYTLSVIKAGSDPSQTANVNVGVLSQEQVDVEYSQPEAVNYKVLTADSYSFSTDSLNFTAEDHSRSMTISVNSTKVKALMEGDPTAEWVLPLIVTSENDSINSEKDQLFLHITDVVVPSVGFVIPDELVPEEYSFNSIPASITQTIEFGLDTDNRWEITCGLAVDEDYITTYNEENGTVYQMLPEGSYTLPESVVLPAGSTVASLELAIDGTQLSVGDYMLPVRVESVSRFAVSQTSPVYPVMIRIMAQELDRTGWTATADSEETTGEGSNGSAKWILDGDINTYWHSIWQNGDGKRAVPYEIVIDTKSTHTFAQIGMIQRNHATYNDTGRGEFYISSDGTNWGSPVGTFDMLPNTALQIFSITPTEGQYIKIKILTSRRDNNCSLSEVYAYGN